MELITNSYPNKTIDIRMTDNEFLLIWEVFRRHTELATSEELKSLDNIYLALWDWNTIDPDEVGFWQE